MASQINVGGNVGPTVNSDGASPALRLGRSGEAIVQQLHGRYYEAALRKTLFTAYCASVAPSLAGVAMVGLQLWNGSPVVNGVNLVSLKIGGAIIVTSAGCVGLAIGSGTGQVSAPTGQTAATRVSNNFIGGPSPQALATSAGTFTNAPTAFAHLLHNTAAIAVTGEDPGFSVDLDGSIIVPPQSYLCVIALGAAVAAAGANLHLMWEEVPV